MVKLSWKTVSLTLVNFIFSYNKKNKKKMHRNTINNIASNYRRDYQLDEGKCLEDLKELVARHYPTKYRIYAYICDNALDSRVEMHGRIFLVIMDSELNHRLVENLARTFHLTPIMSWRETEKIGHGYKQSNLYKKLKIWR